MRYLVKELLASCVALDGKFQFCIHSDDAYIDLLVTPQIRKAKSHLEHNPSLI